MDALFKSGVRYLSRDEEERAMAKATERRDRGMVHHSLDVKETDHESLEFLKAVRLMIDDWLALGDVDRPTLSQDDFPVLTFQISSARAISISLHRPE